MHDIGKIGIPDHVLLKKGRLDDGERRIIQQHCVIGHEIIGDHHSQLLRSAAWLRSPTMSAGTATAIPRD